ncbi:hypothetical protein GS503_14490 [Rhodococcus hoagii]|nr:hypothetical protein [Prescottella equi]
MGAFVVRGTERARSASNRSMDETAAWDLALWQLEMDEWMREHGEPPP